MSGKDFFIPGIASDTSTGNAATASSIFKAAYYLEVIDQISEYNISKAANKDQAEAARLLSKAVKGAWDAIRECIPDMTDTEFESAVLAATADIADEAVIKELKKRGYRITQATNDASDIEKNGQHYMHGIL